MMALHDEYIALLDKQHRFPCHASTDAKIKLLAEVVEKRLAALEANSHIPVTFVEDENGFLKVDKNTTDSKGGKPDA